MSISATLAQSKQEPSPASSFEDLRRRVGLHRVDRRGCPAWRGRRSGSCRGRRRGRRPGRGLRVVGGAGNRGYGRSFSGTPQAKLLRTAGRPAAGRSMWRRSFRRHASRFAGLSGWFAGGSRQADRAVRSFAAFAWSGRPVPHARQEVDASSVTPADGKPTETKKARYVVALSRVLRSVRDLPRRFALGLLRPQARANLGSAVGRAKRFHNQERFAAKTEKSMRRGTHGMNETVVGEKGMAVAPHRAAAETAAEVMRAGGNAVEAMIAAAATIAVVYPHMNSIGGDAFCADRRARQAAARVIDGCGAAGSLATIERYRKEGLRRACRHAGRCAALTVAGAVSGLGTWRGSRRQPRRAPVAARPSRRRHRPGARGRAGQPLAVAQDRRQCREPEGRAGLCRALPRRRQGAGDRHATGRQPRLADTLDQLAHAGFDDFYRGDVAARDRGRSRGSRQPGDARRPAPPRGAAQGAAVARSSTTARCSTRRRRPRGSPR